MKYHLKLEKENQGRSFDSTKAFSSLSIIRVIGLEWLRRTSQDSATMGTIFSDVKDALEDLPFGIALKTLLQRFSSLSQILINAGVIKSGCEPQVQEIINAEIEAWANAMSNFIKDFCERFINIPISRDKLDDKINTSF